MRYRAALFLAIIVAGCESHTSSRPWTQEEIDRATQLVNEEPWHLTGRFGSWELKDLISNGRVYLERETPNDPKRGPALLSEIVERGDASVPLREIVETEYKFRPAGGIRKVWIDEPGLFVFEGYYDAEVGMGRYPFRCVGRLARLKGGKRIAVLTYTELASEFFDRDVPTVIRDLKAQSLK